MGWDDLSVKWTEKSSHPTLWSLARLSVSME